MAKLVLSLLGSVKATLEGAPVAFATDKTLALLIYLAVENGQAHRRELLAGLLWPDQHQERAAQSLRQALSHLRRTLNHSGDSDSFLLVDRQTICFNPESDTWLDVAEFRSLEAGCKRHQHRSLQSCLPCLRRLERMAGLYQGGFLKDFYISDSSLFSEWATLTSEALHRPAIESLGSLVEFYARRGDTQLALQYAWRQAALEPWREETHRDLMRLLAASGQRSAALAQFQHCRRLLADELGVEPTTETVRLYKQIREDEPGKEFGPLQEKAPFPASISPDCSPASFVGRERELNDLAELIATPNCRLITVTGPGGVGKTRLAWEAASQHAGLFSGGIVYLPLAALPAADSLLPALARALSLVVDEERKLHTQIVQFLRARELLLVLDNLEHLPDAADTLTDLLQHAPRLILLGTSRERLRLQEEWVYPLQGLDTPPEGAATSGTYSAVTLFESRARQADSSFQPGTEYATIARICRLVEGLPLALELAAAWVGIRSCSEIAVELEKNRAALASPLRNVPARQRSIRSTLDYSWDLLTPQEQSVFMRLSVFRSGFTPQAALQVAGVIPEVLSGLAAKSLVRLAGYDRYEMHELVRQYAAEKLAAAPSLEEGTRQSHAAYFASWLNEQAAHLHGTDQHQARQAVGLELENARVAWTWSVERGQTALAAQCLDSLYDHFNVLGRYKEGIVLFAEAVQRWQAEPTAKALWAKICARLGALCYPLGDYEQAKTVLEKALVTDIDQQDLSEQCFCLTELSRWAFKQGRQADASDLAYRALSLARQAGELYEAARALYMVAQLRYRVGDIAQARSMVLEGLALSEQSGNLRLSLSYLNVLGDLSCHAGNYTEAQQTFEKCVALSRELGNPFHLAIHLNNLGTVFHLREDYTNAIPPYEQSLAICREIGDQSGQAIALSNLGEVAFVLGDYAEAERAFTAGLALGRDLKDTWAEITCLNNMGEIACAQNKPARARSLFVEALRLVMEFQEWSLGTKILVNGAALLVQEGKAQQAAAFLTLASQHTAAEQNIRDKATGLLEKLPTPPKDTFSSLEEALGQLLLLLAK